MRRSISALILLLLMAAALPSLPVVYAQGVPQAAVHSQYLVNRYGYAVANETVVLTNKGSSAMQIPDVQIGLGNLSSLVSSFSVTGAGYSVTGPTASQGQAYTVSSGGATLAAGANSAFSFKALLSNVTKTSNGTMTLMILDKPYLSFATASEKLTVKMPDNTQLVSAPSGYKSSTVGANVTYYQMLNGTEPQQALVESKAVQQSTTMDLHPVTVRDATRKITVASDGSPMVEDSITLQNLGVTALYTLTVAPLTSANGQIMIVPSVSPPILSAARVLLSNKGIDLTNKAVGLPVDSRANLTITYEYPLAKQYYNVSGGVVTLNLPVAPPIAAFVESYSLGLSLPPGTKVVQGEPRTMTGVQPTATGSASFSYSLSVGWALDSGVPAASSLFVILLIGLFAARTRLAPAEEEEEETATERSVDMVKAFEEKTSLINGMFEEIPKTDPNQLGKAYFDELRGRLDVFRSRALQRLNEMKQKSTTQKFFDLLGQIHETEREVDRAAKDMLNLYEQFYTKRMRQEVFDRLLPNYKRRLEKALDRLSDELNTAQRESKLL